MIVVYDRIQVLQYWLYDRTVITIVNYDPKTFIVQTTGYIKKSFLCENVCKGILGHFEQNDTNRSNRTMSIRYL